MHAHCLGFSILIICEFSISQLLQYVLYSAHSQLSATAFPGDNTIKIAIVKLEIIITITHNTK